MSHLIRFPASRSIFITKMKGSHPPPLPTVHPSSYPLTHHLCLLTNLCGKFCQRSHRSLSHSHIWDGAGLLRKDRDSDIYSLSSQLCNGKAAPFHKYINSKTALAEQKASQYLLSKSYNVISRRGRLTGTQTTVMSR